MIDLRLGRAEDVLPTLEAESFDAVVTDPPYGLSREPDVAEVLTQWLAGDDYRHRGGGFMGRSWDGFVPGPSLWREVWRVLKPGGHLLAFGGTRTVDLLTIALRLAGFEIRDSIHWLYGSGFPKSLNISKAIDKAAGAEREVVGKRTDRAATPMKDIRGGRLIGGVNGGIECSAITAPATDAAKQWQGWGTALKPAHEPIVLARKPLVGTVAANVLRHGCGALNVDACRVGYQGKSLDQVRREAGSPGVNGRAETHEVYQGGFDDRSSTPIEFHLAGRWPPNLVLIHHPGCTPSGERRVKGRNPGNKTLVGDDTTPNTYNGSYSARSSVGHADADGLETVQAWTCVEGCPVAELNRQSGERTSGGDPKRRFVGGFSRELEGRTDFPAEVPSPRNPRPANAGGASRFFPTLSWSEADFLYCPKASRRERNAGMTPTTKVKVRADLTPEQRAYVVRELEAAGVAL